MLRDMGIGYRLHVKGLPGKPDIVMKGRKKIVFVHGCFWHQHEGCRDGTMPKTRTEYWQPKLGRNIQRDIEARQKLKSEGWEVLVVWDCETKNTASLKEKLAGFLNLPDERFIAHGK
jgi:DNA mismatch endonuclease, patch repair protein